MTTNFSYGNAVSRQKNILRANEFVSDIIVEYINHSETEFESTFFFELTF